MLKSVLSKTDSQIDKLIKQEMSRHQNGLNLIASENYPSKAVLEATGSILSSKKFKTGIIIQDGLNH